MWRCVRICVCVQVAREEEDDFGMEMDMPEMDDLSSVAEQPSMSMGLMGEAPGALDETKAFFEDSQLVNEEDVEAEAEAPTEEELKEWSSRTRKTLRLLKNHMDDNETVDTGKLLQGCSRPTAAAVFYQLLVLKTHNKLDVQQDAPYSNIMVSQVAAA
jgi:cohesin complex subunit SCC1